MVNGEHRNPAARPVREDLSLDFQYTPEEPFWDEEDGLFDGEEIVVP